MNPAGITHGAELDDKIDAAYQDLIYQRKIAACFKFSADHLKLLPDEATFADCQCPSPYQQALENFTDDHCKSVFFQ